MTVDYTALRDALADAMCKHNLTADWYEKADEVLSDIIHDWPELRAAVPDAPCHRCGGREIVRSNPWTRSWMPCPVCTPYLPPEPDDIVLHDGGMITTETTPEDE